MRLTPPPDVFATASWEVIQPFYDALAAQPLEHARLDDWLHAWSELEEAIDEAAALAAIAAAGDTGDAAKMATYLRFTGMIEPHCQEQRVRLAARLLAFEDDRADLVVMRRRFRVRRDLFRSANAPLFDQLAALEGRYQTLTGAFTVWWEGQETPVPRLRSVLRDPERSVRERAFRAQLAPYLVHREPLADLFDAQFALRQQIAANADFVNYRDYAFAARERFDYGPEDCARFHDAIAAVVVPALARRYRRRRDLALDRLRPWDVEVDPMGRAPVRAYETTEELLDRLTRVLDRVDPVFGEQFATMAAERLLDLEARPGKLPLGFCTVLSVRRRPAIMLSGTGDPRSVLGVLHEAGHAMHRFAAFAQPLWFQWFPSAEMGELAAMTMELLAAPYLGLDHGGFYDAETLRRVRIEQLEGILAMLPWIAAIDAFQHWIYTDEAGGDRDARDAAWLRIAARFDPGLDWDGLTTERTATWLRQPHLFLLPFYFLEYAIAQLGALQIWRASRADPDATVADYRRALALGDTRPLPELFAVAGARLAFDEATLFELIAAVEEELAALDAQEQNQ